MILKKKRSRLYVISQILYGASIVSLLVGGWLGWSQWQANQAADKKAEHTTQQANRGDTSIAPSTVKPKPSEFDTYTVAPDRPRYLFIPKLSVRAMVKPLGLVANNHIDAPRSAFDAGWYVESAKPGQAGAMFIDGHVSGGAVPGIFHNITSLIPGDTLQVQRGDGALLTYTVIKSQTYSIANVDMSTILEPMTNKPGLNIMTCGGNVIKGTNNFDKRIVVFAEQSS
jgi:sortase (surface protein transpeptidase)